MLRWPPLTSAISLRIISFLVSALLFAGAAIAQTTTTYSYDALQRITQANGTDGTTLQYSYDANGNLLTFSRGNPSVLALNKSLDVNLSVPGQSATGTFVATAGQSVTIDINSITTNPANASITLFVYNASGTLVGSTNGTASESLTLGNLAAGNYSFVIAPPSATTGVLELTLVPSTDSSSGDAPLPAWAYLALGLGLLGILHRQNLHVRGVRRSS